MAFARFAMKNSSWQCFRSSPILCVNLPRLLIMALLTLVKDNRSSGLVQVAGVEGIRSIRSYPGISFYQPTCYLSQGAVLQST